MGVLGNIAKAIKIRFGRARVDFKTSLVLSHILKKIKRDKRAAPGVRMRVVETANSIFLSSKKQMLIEVMEHQITKEMGRGPKANHTSGILQGGASNRTGNLYSFFGFGIGGGEVVGNLILKLRLHTTFNKRPVIRHSMFRLVYDFKVKMPSLAAINSATQTPWGVSWAKGIETGVGGIEAYLYSKTGTYPRNKKSKDRRKKSMTPPSRSGTAIQVKGKFQGKSMGARSFSTRQYLTPIMLRFKKKIQTISR